jgi:hypothetical protein
VANLKTKLKDRLKRDLPGGPTGLFTKSLAPLTSSSIAGYNPGLQRPKHQTRQTMVSSKELDAAGHPLLAVGARMGENSPTGQSMVWEIPGMNKKRSKKRSRRDTSYVKQGSTYAKNRAREEERIKNLPAPEEKETKPAGPVKFKKLDSNRYP